MKPNRKCRRATSCTTFALAITFLGALLGTAFVSVTTEAQGRSLLTRLPAVPEETSQDLKKKELRREAEKVEKDAEGKGQESDPYAFFVPGVVVFLYLGFGTIYSTEYFMPMGDIGGKVAVAFGVIFVLLVVGVALKEVME